LQQRITLQDRKTKRTLRKAKILRGSNHTMLNKNRFWAMWISGGGIVIAC
jgi:hypothetical protein